MLTEFDFQVLDALDQEIDRLNDLGRAARMAGNETLACQYFTEKAGVNNAKNIVRKMMMNKDKN